MQLKGKRLTIRDLTREDIPILHRWWNDPVVMRELRAEKFKPSLEQIEQAWPSIHDPGANEYHEYIISLGGKPVGEVGFLFQDLNPRTVTVDIKIGEPSLWGQGLGTEAMKLFVDYIFNDLNVSIVAAQPGDWNKRGIRLFKNLGFKEVRREEMPATAVHDGGTILTLQLERE